MDTRIKAAKKGNEDAFMELIEENMQSLYKIGWAYLKQEEDIADAIQDTILKCYEKLHTLRQPKYFKTCSLSDEEYIERMKQFLDTLE